MQGQENKQVFRKVVGPIIGLLVAGFCTAPLAGASCIGPPPLTTVLTAANVAFVGTVLATSDMQRLALVRVESVWSGDAIPARVVVDGGYRLPGVLPGRNVATSVDRQFQVNQRYLFLPTNGEAPFTDTACTTTRPYTPDLEAYRPPTAHPPDLSLPTAVPLASPGLGAGAGGQGRVTTLALAAGFLLVLALGTVVVRKVALPRRQP